MKWLPMKPAPPAMNQRGSSSAIADSLMEEAAAARLEPHCSIAGGAGFIGSHFIDRLLGDATTSSGVTVYDNFSSGRRWHFEHHAGDAGSRSSKATSRTSRPSTEAMAGHDAVIHLASNPDIARRSPSPDIDFDQGTLLTHHVVEAMRRDRSARILYASGSGVYGDLGEFEADEDHGPLEPVSTYGASKLAGEALIAAYAHMFGLRGRAFRSATSSGPARRTASVSTSSAAS